MKWSGILLLICLTVACNRQLSDMSGFSYQYKLNACDTVTIQDYIKNVELVPLDTSKFAFFRNVDKAIISDSLIYIGDYSSSSVLVYDLEGRFRSVLKKRGRGKGEYLELKNFTVDKDYIYTIDNFKHKVHIYDKCSMDYVMSKNLPFVAWDMASLGTGRFVFAFIPLPGGSLKENQPPYRILITDNDFKFIDGLYPLEKDMSEPLGYRSYFVESGNNLYFSSFVFDGITEFDKMSDNIIRIGFQFTDPIPEKYRFDTDAVNESEWTYSLSTPIPVRNYISLELSMGDYSESFVFCTRTKTLLANAESKTGIKFLSPICGYDNKFISLLKTKEEYDYLIRNGMPEVDESVLNILSSGGYAMLIYEMY